jgi:hypothetical protein
MSKRGINVSDHLLLCCFTFNVFDHLLVKPNNDQSDNNDFIGSDDDDFIGSPAVIRSRPSQISYGPANSCSEQIYESRGILNKTISIIRFLLIHYYVFRIIIYCRQL